MSDYFGKAITPDHYNDTIARLVKCINEKFPNVEGIAFRGMSGALVAMPVCVACNKTPMLIRKPRENTHGGSTISRGITSYIIVDDFVETGTTAREIRDHITELCPQAVCVGIVCYEDSYEKEVKGMMSITQA